MRTLVQMRRASVAERVGTCIHTRAAGAERSSSGPDTVSLDRRFRFLIIIHGIHFYQITDLKVLLICILHVPYCTDS